MYHRPSKKGGCFICSWVKNESPVGPQQPQIGGIQSSFFWPTSTSNDVWGIPYKKKNTMGWELLTMLNPHSVGGEHGLFEKHESEDIRTIFYL